MPNEPQSLSETFFGVANQTRTEPLDRLAEARPGSHNVIDFGTPPSAPFLVVYSDHGDTKAIRNAVLWAFAEAREAARLRSAAELLWGVVANASNGNWEDQSDEWQEAAARARDAYFAALVKP